MRIMDFILMSLFIRMPGGLGPFGGNKLQTLPMHFKTHQCHIKGKKMFPFLSVPCTFHVGEPDEISHGSFYSCKLIPYLCWDFSRIHKHVQMRTHFFPSIEENWTISWLLALQISVWKYQRQPVSVPSRLKFIPGHNADKAATV